jgi:O-antigen ligase
MAFIKKLDSLWEFPLWYLIKYIGLFVSIWLLIGSLFSSLNPIIYALGIAIGALAYKKPTLAIYLLLLSTPLFGNRPPTPQTHYLIVLSSFLIIGLYSHIFLLTKEKKDAFVDSFKNRDITLFFIFFWFFASLLSLIGLPLLGAIKHSLDEGWLYSLEQILIVGELTLFYSFSSVFYSIQALMIGAFIYAYYSIYKDISFIKNILLALLAGLFISIIAGQLEYFNIISLDWSIRGNSITATRVTSFFKNSSWYAQYLAILMPLLSVLLLINAFKKATIPIMILLVIIGEVTLILAMQRGAWITYPPTLFLIWVSIYYTLAKKRDAHIGLRSFFKKNWLKIFITIPLTVSMSIFIVYGIKDYQANNNISVKTTFEQTTSRAQAIANTNDRLKFWSPAMQLFKENPIFGGGGDSFGWQYKVYYMEEDRQIYKGSPSDTLQTTTHGTSHNMYLQSLTGRGVFGLVFLLGIFGTLIYRLFKMEVSDSASSLDKSIIGLSILGVLSATMIYGNVQEIFYIQSVQVIFWVVVFIGVSLLPKQKSYKRQTKILAIGMIALLPIHFFTNHFIQEQFLRFIG